MTWEELCKQIKDDITDDGMGLYSYKYDRGQDAQDALEAFADELVKRIEAEPWRYLQTTIDEMLNEAGVLRQ